MTASWSESLHVRGADARAYVDGQCSQDLGGLAPRGRALALVLDPAGTLVACCVVHGRGDDALELEVPVGVAQALERRLARFAIRADVVFEHGTPTTPDPLLADEAARVHALVPGPSELSHGLVPHALDPALTALAVSFTKGCYPGQELVARMQSRHATPPYLLRGLRPGRPVAVGDAVGGARFEGAVTSVVEAPEGRLALCVLHRSDASGATVAVHAHDGDVLARLVEGPSVRS